MEGINHLKNILKKSIEKGEEIAPFLCIGNPLPSIHQSLYDMLLALCSEYEVDKNYIFSLSDTGESLKIGEMKKFISYSFQKSSFSFQIFIIENFSRATEEASNAALKFFEEPGKGNIIFLTSESESGILDTILSRVQITSLGEKGLNSFGSDERSFRIENYIHSKSYELISNIFQEKIEKTDAILFLQTLLSLHSLGKLKLKNLADLESDIQGLAKNNLLPRYIVDKWILNL